MPIDVPRLFSALVNRFRSYRTLDDIPQLASVISPVTVVDEHLRDTFTNAANFNLTGSGQVTIATVPAGKRWRLHHFRQLAKTGSSRLRILSPGAANPCIVSVAGTGELSYAPEGLPLSPGSVLQADASGNAADSSIAHYWLYTEEDTYN